MPIASPPKAVLRTADVIYALADSRNPSDADTQLTGTDDHVQVNADIVAGARKILFMDGTYNGLGIIAVDDMDIGGYGRGITTLKLKDNCSQAEADAQQVALISKGNGNAQWTGCKIHNLTFDGNKANQDNTLVTPGIWYFCGVGLWYGAYLNTLERVEFKNCPAGGAYVEGFSDKGSGQYYRSWGNKLKDIITHDNGRSGGWGDNGGANRIFRAGIELDEVVNIDIEGLRCYDEVFYDVQLVDSVRAKIRGYDSVGASTDGTSYAAINVLNGVGLLEIADFDIWHPNGKGISIPFSTVPGVIQLDNGRLIGIFLSVGINITSDRYDVFMNNVVANAFQTNLYCNDVRKIHAVECNFDNADQVGSGTLGYNIDLYQCDEVLFDHCQSRWANQHCFMVNGSTQITVKNSELHDYHDESLTYALLDDANAGQNIIYIAETNGRYFREGDVIHVQGTGEGPEKARILTIDAGRLTLKDNLGNNYTTANSALIHKLNSDSYRVINEQGAAESNVYQNNRLLSSSAAKITLIGTENVYDDKVLSDELDLSGAAIDVDTFRVRKAGILCGYWIHYTEASSADAGVDIRIGRYQDGVALDDNYFDNTTSEVSKNLGYSTYITLANLTQSALAAGDIITVGTAGGKTGTGNVRIELDIMYGLD